jgi:hypothetical protein
MASLQRTGLGRLRRFCVAIVVAMCGASGLAATTEQQPEPIAVIVHPQVQVDDLSLPDLRRYLLGEREFWPSGARVTIFIRAPIARERDVVVRDICEMTEAQFRKNWIAKVFRAETPSAPKIVYSTEMAIDQVSRLPGAVSFVAASAVTPAVKVLAIDGRRPGDPDYRFR